LTNSPPTVVLAAASTQASPKRELWTARTMLVATAIFVAACFLNGYRSAQAMDINSDEVSYALQSVALYQSGMTRWAGRPFLVHPPLFFTLEGAYFRWAHVGMSPMFEALVNSPQPVGAALVDPEIPISQDDIFNAIMVGRRLVVVYGALVAVGLFLFGAAFGSPMLGVAAAAVSLVDPYMARRNHFNMLEPLTTLCGLLMVAAFYGASSQTNARRRRILFLLTGVFLGLALLSKELAVLYVPPLLIFAVVFRRIKLNELALPFASGLLIYAVFPVWAWLNGDFATWLTTRTWLFQRFSGSRNDTGISRPETTVTRTIIASLVDYWPSIALLVSAGMLAALFVCVFLIRRRRDRPGELLTAFVLGIYGCFLVVWRIGGVINDQFFYLVMPLSILTVVYLPTRLAALLGSAGVAPELASARPHDGLIILWLDRLLAGTVRAVLRGVARLAAVLFLVGLAGLSAYNTYMWVVRYAFGNDDSYARVEGQLAAGLPVGTAVVGRDVTDLFMLPKDVVYWHDTLLSSVTPRWMVQHTVEYAILNDQYLVESYGGANQALYDFVRQYGQPIQQFVGRRWDTNAYWIDYVRVAADLQQGTASLAAGRPAFASSTSGEQSGAENIVDGDFTSGWLSADVDQAWVYVDLGDSVPFRRVELTWEAAFARAYQFQVSEDAQTWTTFYETNQADGGYDVITAQAQGRYVRLLMTQPGTNLGYYALAEIEVRRTDFGPAAPGAPDQPPPAPLSLSQPPER
jgi:4-amino-4-deoxy-L-arabinose transferase-like glycosyltransferase